MALIHEKLYESKDLAKIDFREYIQSLTAFLFDSYSLKPEQIQLKMQMGEVFLDMETAIPLGLLINELVSNSLKYAFPHKRRGELLVKLEEIEDEEYDYTLIVRDNGVGFPDHLDSHACDSLGMVLVHSLVKKLKGVIDLERKDGTGFTIKFKKLNYKKRI
jgi:two-component sensor histidine kinase